MVQDSVGTDAGAAAASTPGIQFKYRFVPSGTRFAAVAGSRISAATTEEDKDDDKRRLFDNEVAVGVGRQYWDGDAEKAAIIDHRVLAEGALPSVAVAVMHHAEPLHTRGRTLDSSLVWLVTVDRPNFDCYAAMYLARWFMEDGSAADGFRNARFTSDGFAADPSAAESDAPPKRFDWFKPDLTRFSEYVRWAVRLASFAAHTDRARRIPCRRNRTVHSILYAAVERGRPYATEDNGAHELFEEVRSAMRGDASKPSLDPLYDSVLENSALFKPELALLDGAAEAYERDIARARKAIVFLPAREETFTALYKNVTSTPLIGADGKPERAHLSFGLPRGQAPADGAREQFDGLYLRDPECILIREWARHDIDNSSQRDGFTFTMIARSGRHPGSNNNDNDYALSVDPNRARRCHLYPLWAELQAAEVKALQDKSKAEPVTGVPKKPRDGYAERAGTDAEFFVDPWYDGVDYSCRVIGSPNRGTLLRVGTDRGLEDDGVAKIVRDQLELVAFKPPFYLHDVAARSSLVPVNKDHNVESAHDDEDRPQELDDGRYRFGSVLLAKYVKLESDVFAEQTARVLWRMLHPKQQDGPPRELAEECCVREGEMLGVWSTSGVMIAYKESAAESVEALRSLFDKLAKLARGVDGVILDYSRDQSENTSTAGTPEKPAHDVVASEAQVQLVLQKSRDLTRLMVEVRQGFGLPAGHMIERFASRSGLFDAIGMLHDATRSEQTQSNLDLTARLTTASVTVASVQLKVELLELIFVGIYSTELAHIIAPHVVPPEWELAFTLGIALLLSSIAATYLKPWKHKELDSKGEPKQWAGRPLLIGFIVVILLGIAWGLWTGGKSLFEPPTVSETTTIAPLGHDRAVQRQHGTGKDSSSKTSTKPSLSRP